MQGQKEVQFDGSLSSSAQILIPPRDRRWQLLTPGTLRPKVFLFCDCRNRSTMCMLGSIRTDRQGRSSGGRISWLQLVPEVELRNRVRQIQRGLESKAWLPPGRGGLWIPSGPRAVWFSSQC